MLNPFASTCERTPRRPRTLVVHDNTIWLWPGVPLTLKLDGKVWPLPARTIHFWISRLHGFEADPNLVQAAIRRAAGHLSRGDRQAAEAALELARLERISPEGSALANAVGERLGIETPDFIVGARSAPWGFGEVLVDLPRFCKFAAAAVALQKPGIPKSIRVGRPAHRIDKAAGSVPPTRPLLILLPREARSRASVITADHPSSLRPRFRPKSPDRKTPEHRHQDFGDSALHIRVALIPGT